MQYGSPDHTSEGTDKSGITFVLLLDSLCERSLIPALCSRSELWIEEKVDSHFIFIPTWSLTQVGVRATFFINSDNLHLDDPALVAQNKQSLVRMVTEGHVVGDHSYDHMAHNTINDSPR